MRTPLPATYNPSNEGETNPNITNQYGSKVGSINFAATQTRPDIAFSTSILSQKLKAPTEIDLKAADHLIRYLYATKDLSIKYGDQDDKRDFFGCSDASFADEVETRRSSEGYVFFLYGGAIDWKATKQTMVTKSSTEAELYSLSHACTELIWWSRLFVKINLKLRNKPTVLCDNRQTIRIITGDSYKLHTRMRHVDVQQCWMREKYQNKEIRVEWVGTNEIQVDGFTKILPQNKHYQYVEQLRLTATPTSQ